MPRKDYKSIAHQALKLLLNTEGCDGIYDQVQVVQMLKNMGLQTATSTFTGFKQDLENVILKKKVNGSICTMSPKRLRKFAEPLEQLVEDILGLEFTTTTFEKTSNVNWKKIDWLNKTTSESITNTSNQATFHIGRWTPNQKASFMANAEKEVINLGLRLSNFAFYFTKFGDDFYKSPIIKLLERGVTVKCYMLDPKEIIAKLYFQDRALINKEDDKGEKQIEKVQKKLFTIATELNATSHSGGFEIYTYNHIPTSHFLSIDKDTPNAKMLVSPYLYGIDRAKAPHWVFHKSSQPKLYNAYSKSLAAIIEGAHQIFPSPAN